MIISRSRPRSPLPDQWNYAERSWGSEVAGQVLLLVCTKWPIYSPCNCEGRRQFRDSCSATRVRNNNWRRKRSFSDWINLERWNKEAHILFLRNCRIDHTYHGLGSYVILPNFVHKDYNELQPSLGVSLFSRSALRARESHRESQLEQDQIRLSFVATRQKKGIFCRKLLKIRAKSRKKWLQVCNAVWHFVWLWPSL